MSLGQPFLFCATLLPLKLGQGGRIAFEEDSVVVEGVDRYVGTTCRTGLRRATVAVRQLRLNSHWGNKVRILRKCATIRGRLETTK
jgi:hypothetical protein